MISRVQRPFLLNSGLGTVDESLFFERVDITVLCIQVETYPEQFLFMVLDPTLLVHREGNGTPLQYSCLENPMDGGAW